MAITLRNASMALLALAAFLTGGAQPVNPSFPVSMQEAREDLARMREEPHELSRPLLIIGGFGDPGINAKILKNRFDSLTMNEGIVGVEIGICPTMNSCRDKVIADLEKVYPSGDPEATVEVDVIGLSMGGVVAHYASLPNESGGKRLRIARLFTISSPLQGANEASYFPSLWPDRKSYPVIRSLRKGSTFLEDLNAQEPEYPVFSYVRLHDFVVGSENAALPGRTAWWVATPFPGSVHVGAMHDARIIADIARRLRDEAPLTMNPPAPLPVSKS